MMAATITIAPMRHWHLRDVHAIDAKVYPRPWSLALWRQEIAMLDTRHYIVAESGGNVVGHAGIMYVLNEGHVTTVAVDPQWQGRGIATQLVSALCRHAHTRKTSALTLEVRVSNDRAISLYRRFGFAPAGVRKNYYSEINEDALVMWAHDVDQPAYLARLRSIDDDLGGTVPNEEED
ncbi:MAG: ribosomal-protein-alanine N-acetyltransferase [Actinobacteria bacterium]|jgi:ribosomal-protein-alanine N-acetyltransferase|nr:MAG: ribosomal-protein-alanine N-acetyltransferase [Actinomycetota bacterium]